MTPIKEYYVASRKFVIRTERPKNNLLLLENLFLFAWNDFPHLDRTDISVVKIADEEYAGGIIGIAFSVANKNIPKTYERIMGVKLRPL